MGKGRILVVEDDITINPMLRIYFDSQGYEVFTTARGTEALDICRVKLPNVVILDINLPDINGYEVCRTLRNNIRTSNVPIIFLTQMDDRHFRISGLELGADDYVTKPFDIEELKLRVEGTIRRSMRTSLSHPVTNLPAGKLIEEYLAGLLFDVNWSMLSFTIQHLDAFKEAMGFGHMNAVLILLADIIRETVEAHGTMDDFIGQASDNNFIVITTPWAAGTICNTVTHRFNMDSNMFYFFPMREVGKITYVDVDGVTQESDFMELAVGVVSSEDGPFADALQITEDAAENRRRGGGCP